ncbi:hypothetical protein X797_012470 [Metarhizium robertsii]|uniref:Uncharacterized protein n=1 Tax=Metarhizium robertsii TaxID=568076 RepID=A0A014MTJ5_9HYPO|nr:hypothetical protein X797_012470 [Metarhizium robertsii]
MQKYIAAFETNHSIDRLPGARPTRILLGYWKPSSEVDPKDRHAAYGILCQDDSLRVRVVRETRDGRFVDGNFPSGAGSQIFYEEVEFEPHLQALSKEQIKEYCRIRQHQLDHGETSAERVENETKAVYEARIRAGTMAYRKPRKVTVPMFAASPLGDGDKHLNGQSSYVGPEFIQLRRTEVRSIQASPDEDERHTNGLQSIEIERIKALARREITRTEAAQSRADRQAIHREHAVTAAAAGNSSAATVAVANSEVTFENHSKTDSQIPFYKPEDMQRLHRVWARQETLRNKSSSENIKTYDGHKYERRTTGPFKGKLVSQGTIISIDGDDYVEYCVLTKPSVF